MIEQKAQRTTEIKNEIARISGLQIDLEHFTIHYDQFPQPETKLTFNSLQILNLSNEVKTKIIEFTSTSKRQSRETLFVDNSIKKDTSRPDLFKSEVISQPVNERQKEGEIAEQQKKVSETQRQ